MWQQYGIIVQDQHDRFHLIAFGFTMMHVSHQTDISLTAPERDLHADTLLHPVFHFLWNSIRETAFEWQGQYDVNVGHG